MNVHITHSITVVVRGMDCDDCVRCVIKGISTIPGVTGVHVDLPTGRVQIDYTGCCPELDALARTIDDIGYEYGGAV